MKKLELNQPVQPERITRFADLILPVPVPRLFTYRVPFQINDKVSTGCRVIVQFGRKKILTGIIANLHTKPPEGYEAKYILELLDEYPSVNSIQLNFFSWIAAYYMCTIGEVLNVALPSGLKLSSESKVQLFPGFKIEDSNYPFTDAEIDLLQALIGTDNLTYDLISSITGLKNIYTLLKSLVQKNSIIIFEEIKEKYRPKKERRIRLTSDFSAISESLESLFNTLEAKPRQTEVLLYYLQHIPVYSKPELNKDGITKNDFKQAGLSVSSVNTLVRNGVFEEFDYLVSRFPEIKSGTKEIVLSRFQTETKKDILKFFETGKPVLLHGVTGSGKTEIYIQLIQQVLESGNQALYLLPEIALTTQIVTRLRKVFGDQMGVYHSRFSDNERVEIWNGVLQGRFSFIVGVRSSVFLPFDNLGLIIIDEEHETSYKQMEPAPRYHARDSALVLARLHHAKVLLGSSTPSLETYFNVKQGHYELVELKERYGKAVLPEMLFANTRTERQKKIMKGDFTSLLVKAIKNSLSENEQVIIFQNRRGYAPYLNCETCGWIPQCAHCSVSLTYHLYKNELKCHYCGYNEKVPVVCTSCGSMALKTKSYGTEKLEEDLKLMFPDCVVRRMDLDTTRLKYGYQSIIEDFEKGNIDILVGTQMVSKGLDFNKVALVGIFDADRMLHFPDFRSHEKTFQLITQVSGRAGRRDKKGRVIIQTYNPGQHVLQMIKAHDYVSFYRIEIAERERYKYAPFYRLINITLKHKNQDICRQAAQMHAGELINEFGTYRILGPHEGLIQKIRNLYIWVILIKLERNKVNLPKAKEIIMKKSLELKQVKEFRNINLIFDVDPY